MRDAIAACEGETYVVTTKQQRFANALLEHAGEPADASLPSVQSLKLLPLKQFIPSLIRSRIASFGNPSVPQDLSLLWLILVREIPGR